MPPRSGRLQRPAPIVVPPMAQIPQDRRGGASRRPRRHRPPVRRPPAPPRPAPPRGLPVWGHSRPPRGKWQQCCAVLCRRCRCAAPYRSGDSDDGVVGGGGCCLVAVQCYPRRIQSCAISQHRGGPCRRHLWISSSRCCIRCRRSRDGGRGGGGHHRCPPRRRTVRGRARCAAIGHAESRAPIAHGGGHRVAPRVGVVPGGALLAEWVVPPAVVRGHDQCSHHSCQRAECWRRRWDNDQQQYPRVDQRPAGPR
mmetsp:Transcript_18052/g.42665  ORF Transcript_18052/g.42665 Transcript_18052/m.42665 type:complete len:253 (-) Transcript_18052:325-1083(-)